MPMRSVETRPLLAWQRAEALVFHLTAEHSETLVEASACINTGIYFRINTSWRDLLQEFTHARARGGILMYRGEL